MWYIVLYVNREVHRMPNIVISYEGAFKGVVKILENTLYTNLLTVACILIMSIH